MGSDTERKDRVRPLCSGLLHSHFHLCSPYQGEDFRQPAWSWVEFLGKGLGYGSVMVGASAQC
jgi:hypothetical protein